MKNSYNFIMFPLISLHFLSISKTSSSSSAPCCETMYCNNVYSTSIKFPFRVRVAQPESCGCQGFELYCDSKLGLLLELPQAGNFTVEHINYDSRLIKISDPKNCLPQKLLTLDLSHLKRTRFRGGSHIADYQVYNCSGFGYPVDFLNQRRIDCLSGSDYTVVSERRSNATFSDLKCSFLKQVYVPTEFDFSYLSSYSSIYLNWDDQDCVKCVEPPPRNKSSDDQAKGIAVKVVLGGILLSPILFILIRYGMARYKTHQYESDIARNPRPMDRRPEPATSWEPREPYTLYDGNEIDFDDENPSRSTRVNNPTTISAPTSSGINQNTSISSSSFPTMTVEESGILSRPDADQTCSICLSEYEPKEVLKILPTCLHRFHVACIDESLNHKPTCPICITSPFQNLTDHLIV